VAPGDSGHEAYTAIAWGVGLSHERSDIAGAEGFHSLEGNMCGTDMRGADALPGSKATSRAKGSHRNLGGLGFDRSGPAVSVRIGKVRKEPTRLSSQIFGFAALFSPRFVNYMRETFWHKSEYDKRLFGNGLDWKK
jgi:hypothetical protein